MVVATETPMPPVSKKMLWTGYVISALPVLGLLFSGVMALMKPASVVEAFTRFGYPESMIVTIGILKLACTILYIIPRTSVLGAILLAGYLGGATATDVRIGDPTFIAPVVFGVMIWLGLFLREPRLRPLLPLRR